MLRSVVNTEVFQLLIFVPKIQQIIYFLIQVFKGGYVYRL